MCIQCNFQMYDPVNTRYEPPWPIKPNKKPFSSRTAKYRFSTDKVRPGFKVNRVNDGTTL